jgi:bicarbonate transport system ATP-binding protein
VNRGWPKQPQAHKRAILWYYVEMITNGPVATIGEIMTIPHDRLRDRDPIMEVPQYYDLRNYALDFLYNRFAHNDD